jgi:two-component system response regulator AtoC
MITAKQGITEPSKTGVRLIIAESRAMRQIVNVVQRVAVSEASSFLIEAENGTGKDLVLATTLHYQSPRKAGPFLAINCAAIPQTLLESELLGYEKGAESSALRKKYGTS